MKTNLWRNRKYAPDTTRGISEYAADLGFASPQSFLDYIDGKEVLDSGSGAGFLAKECALRGLSTRVYSVNPRLGNHDARNDERRITNLLLRPQSPEAQNRHDELAVAAEAQDLPFKDNCMDIVLDNFAIGYYYCVVNTNHLDVFIGASKEFMRILRTEGKFRTRVVSSALDREAEVELALAKFALQSFGFTVNEVHSQVGPDTFDGFKYSQASTYHGPTLIGFEGVKR